MNHKQRKRHKKKIINSSHSPHSNLIINTSTQTDIISNLPDCILTTILSFLPIKAAAATSALSRRWRHVWTTVPIAISLDDLAPDHAFGLTYRKRKKCCSNVFNEILSRHQGPIVRCKIVEGFDGVDFDGWIKILTHKGIQELTLTMSNHSLYAVPEYMFHCKTLRSLQLVFSSFRVTEIPKPCFVNLQELTLMSCLLRDRTVEELLVGCVALTSLELINCSLTTFGQEKVKLCVCSRSLRRFVMKSICWWEVAELYIGDSPCLECFALSVGTRKYFPIRVFNAPKLKMLGDIAINTMKLEFSKIIINKHRMVDCSKTQVHNVKALAISTSINTPEKIKKLLEILGCFPHIEILEILIEESVATHDQLNYRLVESLDCIEYHIKIVKLKCFSGSLDHMFLAGFLITSCTMLETMTIFHASTWSREKQEMIRGQLLNYRTSSEAQVNFSSYYISKNEFPIWLSDAQ